MGGPGCGFGRCRVELLILSPMPAAIPTTRPIMIIIVIITMTNMEIAVTTDLIRGLGDAAFVGSASDIAVPHISSAGITLTLSIRRRSW